MVTVNLKTLEALEVFNKFTNMNNPPPKITFYIVSILHIQRQIDTAVNVNIMYIMYITKVILVKSRGHNLITYQQWIQIRTTNHWLKNSYIAKVKH